MRATIAESTARFAHRVRTMHEGQLAHEAATAAGNFVRRWRHELVAAWKRASGRTLESRAELVEHVGVLAAHLEHGEDLSLCNTRSRELLDRVATTVGRAGVTRELSLLRTCIIDVWHREHPGAVASGIRALHLALDHLLTSSAQRIADERASALAKLEGLLAASPVGIAFLDAELRYIRINAALARMNGRSVGEHLGRTVRDVIPEVAPMMESMLRRILETGEPVLDLEIESAVGGGPARSFLCSYFPVQSTDGVVTGIGGVVTEVTDRERAKRALEANRTLLESIIEHAPAAIFVKDETGRIVMANAQLADIAGRKRDDVVGARSSDLFTEEVARQHEANDRAVLAGVRAIEAEEQGRGARTFLSSKFAVPGPDGQRWLCGIATDITDRKLMEEELRVALRSREDLLAVVSHDLRNPLGTITLASSMLLGNAELDPRTLRQLDMIHRSAQRMERLINDLLDMASIHAGRISLELVLVDARVLVHDAVEPQQALAQDKQITLIGEPVQADVLVRCDPDRIQRVFSNLIGNAIKFCSSGDTIRVSSTIEGDRIRFKVTDTGPGIAPEQLPNLFEPYWSAPEHMRRGTGLGLYIAKTIVTAHGGTISVESTVGTGTTFVFDLPLAS